MTTEVQAPSVPIYLAGEFVEAGTPLEVRNPATDEIVATTFQAGAERARARDRGGRRGLRGDEAAPELREARCAGPRRGLHRARRRRARHAAEPRVGEADPGRSRRSGARSPDVPDRGRGGAPHQRRVAAPRLGAREQGPARDRAPLPDRSGGGDQPVQLPAQPGRAQGRAGDRGRLQHRAQAAVQGPARACCGSPATCPRPTCRRARSASCRWIGPPAIGWSPTIGSSCSRSPARHRSAGR